MGNINADDFKSRDAEVKLPDNTRWSLGNQTLCGQKGYLRPCQIEDCSRIPETLFPHAPVCKSASEMVIVVDDDPDMLENIVDVVRSLGFPVMGCGTAAELQALAFEYRTGCILLDIRLPGQDGLAIHEWLTDSGVILPVIFISGVGDVDTVVHCMKSGAFEFLQKPFGEMVLRRSVSEAVGLSRKRFCRQESENLIQRLIATLTPTETIVAGLISKGYPTKMIATKLGRSENTIKIHRHRIFNKLMVSSPASVANIINYCHD